tara:strand:+ start:560 stop:1102 length:543 start_codon:yes stop_codon:yes gene_type:complete
MKNKIVLILLALLLLFSGCDGLFRSIDRALDRIAGREPVVEKPQDKVVDSSKWLVPVCLVGVGIGIFVIVGLKAFGWGLAVIAASLATLGLSITVFEHFKLIAWVGLAVVLGILGFVAYMNRKAFAQNILLQEKAKPGLDTTEQVVIYGDGGIADKTQSPAVKKMVAAERKRITKKNGSQ